jgi:hypothetical protein
MTGPSEPGFVRAGRQGEGGQFQAPPYSRLVSAAESWLEEHGDNYRGAGWTKSQANTDTRHRVMLEIVDSSRDTPAALLDIGCGTSQSYECIVDQGREAEIRCSGLDLSRRVAYRRCLPGGERPRSAERAAAEDSRWPPSSSAEHSRTSL